MKTVDDFLSAAAFASAGMFNLQSYLFPVISCRHELAGRVISRTCDNGFDCRTCEKYSHFAVLPVSGNGRPCGSIFRKTVFITEATLG